eukprot:6298908-Prymnesium_polylepis.1
MYVKKRTRVEECKRGENTVRNCGIACSWDPTVRCRLQDGSAVKTGQLSGRVSPQRAERGDG